MSRDGQKWKDPQITQISFCNSDRAKEQEGTTGIRICILAAGRHSISSRIRVNLRSSAVVVFLLAPRF